MSKADLMKRGKLTLEQLRTRSRLSKAALFKAAGVSANTYYTMIRGDKPVRPENAGLVLDALTKALQDRGELAPNERLDFEDVEPPLKLSGMEEGD